MDSPARLPWAARLAFAFAAAAPVCGAPPPGMVLIPRGVYAPLRQAPGQSGPEEVPAFYLDVRPVTNAEYLAFVRANPAWRRSKAGPLFADEGYLGDWTSDLDPGPNAPGDSPVVRVSWFAANAYARWKGNRLPTTTEWERAALAGFTAEEGARDPAYREATLAWYSVPEPSRLPAAGTGRPNVYGVRDMVDLVWEWTEDFNAAPAPQGASCSGAAEDVRDFSDYPAFMRAAFRSSLRASYIVPNLGFRCARSLP